ncbi:hypothetical protein [Heyndrickxia coagulans]|uniref:hypothetical protein n=1 Tax=Heyndrickxia coagulans TaxID=1398 RepID=UPI001C529D8C|nr:hypothetical protein [Heyndrickxia coagulans]
MPKIWLFVPKGTEKVLFYQERCKKTAGHDEWWCPAVSFGLFRADSRSAADLF